MPRLGTEITPFSKATILRNSVNQGPFKFLTDFRVFAAGTMIVLRFLALRLGLLSHRSSRGPSNAFLAQPPGNTDDLTFEVALASSYSFSFFHDFLLTHSRICILLVVRCRGCRGFCRGFASTNRSSCYVCGAGPLPLSLSQRAWQARDIPETAGRRAEREGSA